MLDSAHLVYIHGSGGDKSQTYKARILREIFPAMLAPDFDGELPERMRQLSALLGSESGWTLVGSSLGGLMAALFAIRHPARVKKLVLLAPALTLPEFTVELPCRISVPTLIIQGSRDELIPLETSQTIARQVFSDLAYQVVDDDHRLHKTAGELDWKELLE